MRDRFHTLAVRATLYALWLVLLLASPWAHASAPRVLDAFEDPSPWSVFSSTQVTGVMRVAEGVEGRALCLDFDFHGVSGYVGLRRALPLDYPADYAFDFRVRGEAPSNNLEFKLVDASGDNVWWVRRADYAFPKDWTAVRYKKRHVSKAWGPSPETELRKSASLEFTIASGSGGKGSVCFDQLRFAPLQPDDGSPLIPATPDARQRGAVDGNPATEWTGKYGDESVLILDLGRIREFGGLRIDWAPEPYTPHQRGIDILPNPYLRYSVATSVDGKVWGEELILVSNGGTDWIPMPESESRFVRLSPKSGRAPKFGVRELVIQPLAFAESANNTIRSMAEESPRGWWPRAFSGEQAYWTIVGVDGGTDQGLVSEDGAIELGKSGPSIEPIVLLDGKLVTWADVKSSQALLDVNLPIPKVTWEHSTFELEVTALAADAGRIRARYRLTNRTKGPLEVALALAIRPLQVNPPSQFLNTMGGVASLKTVRVRRDRMRADPEVQAADEQARWNVVADTPATEAFATTLPLGDVPELLVAELPLSALALPSGVDDEAGRAAGAWVYQWRLAPGESRSVSWTSSRELSLAPVEPFDQALAAAKQEWNRKLDAVKFEVPAQGQRMIETLRYALATMLISRKGPRLQPGTRSYARAWIRDGAMIDEALLRLGREDVAREFVSWYAPYQFKDGKVPCCVDDRGSDPVPENDSHGELIYAIAEVYRYTKDRAWLEKHWPNVVGAVAYMDQLRASERTEANRAKDPAFYGLMPASISHEGYSAKAMHSHWDNFWALRGYKDAVQVAHWLGKGGDARRFAASRDQFAADLKASLALSVRTKGLEFIPGSAELGDFDPTSTTIALAPADAADLLPPGLLAKSFDRYWSESQARANGTRAWKDYTPYELRTVGTFVRLGQPERAHAMLDFFFKDQQPAGWRQWAEVVSSTPRKPFFLGDLPHAWVASDYARSVLDLFAYERGDALVLAAGIPLDWLDGDGVAIDGLRTPYGPLAYSVKRANGTITFDIAKDTRVPPGGFVIAVAGKESMIVRAPGRYDIAAP